MKKKKGNGNIIAIDKNKPEARQKIKCEKSFSEGVGAALDYLIYLAEDPDHPAWDRILPTNAFTCCFKTKVGNEILHYVGTQTARAHEEFYEFEVKEVLE